MDKFQFIYLVSVLTLLVLTVVGLLVWQLVSSQLKFRAICENSGNMIVVGKALTGRDGRITDIELVGCNEVYAGHLHKSVDEITGLRIVRDFFEGREPDWLDVIRESITTHESRHLEFTYEPLGTRYSGSVFCLSPVRRRCCFIMDEVSQAYKRRSELQRTRKLMDTILELSGIGMWQWNIKENRFNILKDTFKLVTEQDRGDVGIEEVLARVHPDDRAALMKLGEIRMDGGTAAAATDYRLGDSEGGWRWFQAAAVKTEYDAEGNPESIIGVSMDIDTLKRSRLKVEQISQKLENNQKWLMYSLRQSRTGYCRWVVETDRIYHSDNFWQSVGGLGPEEEAQRNIPDTMSEFRELIVPEDPEGFQRWMESVHEGCPEDYEFRCHISFLPEICLEVRTSTLERDRNGRSSVISAFIIDITAIRKNEEALRAAMKAADDANKAKSRFLAVMSHEIRTPLNAIIGFSSMIRGADIPAKLQSYAESIKSSGEMLLELINELLDLAKIESSKMELKPEPVRLGPVLSEVERMFVMRVKAKQLYLKVECDSNLPVLSLDVKKIRQILVNLVGNAVKFTEKGGVTVAVAAEPAGTGCDAAAGGRLCRLTISVRDTGVGIPEEDFDKIFDPFEQVNKNHNSYVEGTGLGLAICRSLVDLMGGTISCESKVGGGSHFLVALEKVECVLSADEQSSGVDGVSAVRPAGETLERSGWLPDAKLAEMVSLFGGRLREMEHGMHVQSALDLTEELGRWVRENNAVNAGQLIEALRKAVEDFNVGEARSIARTVLSFGGGDGE